MDARELVAAGIARQAELVRGGEVSPRELVEACLDRIERIDPGLNAFRSVHADRALEEARNAESRLQASDARAASERPLLGVPVAIKDDTDLVGDVTTVGTAAHGGPAREDAEVVRRLRAAGAIPIGKTRVPELVIWPFTEGASFGVTRNPWSLDHTPGGSSGGSAAAVAGGLVGGALGSDGAGSIRIPCSCCGVLGVKPQRDRISIAPHHDALAGWHGLSVYGPIAPTVRDAALFLDATAAEVPAEPFAAAASRPPPKLRVALSFKLPPGVTALLVRLDPEVRQATEEFAELLRSLGHEVAERDPDYGTVANHVLVRYLRGIHDDAARMARPERLERRTRGMARLGGLIPDSLLARERAAEGRHAARIGALFAEHDVLLTPVLTTTPVEVGRWEGRDALWTLVNSAAFVAYTPPWNATGQPAAALPAGVSSGGLPIGVQLVGRPYDEATLLSLAAQIEAERPWTERLPGQSISGDSPLESVAPGGAPELESRTRL
jgi:amidase